MHIAPEHVSVMVRVRDLRHMGYCHAGARRWAKRYEIDWNDFVKNGIAIDTLERIDDAMCQRLVAAVKHGR